MGTTGPPWPFLEMKRPFRRPCRPYSVERRAQRQAHAARPVRDNSKKASSPMASAANKEVL